ncbi:MAG: hypothetical protein WC308_02935 [archaeon]|jgi:uncharacterized protein with ATP-grasp and redox domains
MAAKRRRLKRPTSIVGREIFNLEREMNAKYKTVHEINSSIIRMLKRNEINHSVQKHLLKEAFRLAIEGDKIDFEICFMKKDARGMEAAQKRMKLRTAALKKAELEHLFAKLLEESRDSK